MSLRSNVIICTLLALVAQPVVAKLYRWVDADGNTHISDKLPPSQAERARSELNEKGMEIKRIDRAKTPEELAQEKELKRLREEREKIIEKQKAEDRVLLLTFRSEDDIIMAQDGKLTAIDVMIQIATSNIKQSKEQLVSMQNSAANFERRGKKPPAKLLQEIAASRQHLKDSYATIITKEKDKDRIKQKAQTDLKRFRAVKKLQSSQAPVSSQNNVVSQLDYVVTCTEASICDSYWEKAKAYTLKHATTKIKIMGDSVLLTAPPNEDSDISITLSRLANKMGPGENLFFDLQCKSSTLGEKFCQGAKVKSIRSGFRKLLLGENYRRKQETISP
jgi:Domain of unknown function (DUF4124)